MIRYYYLFMYKNVAKVVTLTTLIYTLNALLLTGFEKHPARQSYAHLKIKIDFHS